MPLPRFIPLDSLPEAFYTGSVQRLHAIPGCDTHMVAETTSRGSVFDVGSIFEVEGSDLSRAVFRHVLYSRMATPELWQEVRQSLETDTQLPERDRRELLEEPMAQLCAQGARTHHEGMIDADSGEVVTSGAPKSPSRFNVVRRYQILKPSPVEILGQHLFDYSVFAGKDGFVIPMEYIVRFGITSSSSIYKKYLKLSGPAQTTYLRDLGTGSALVPWTYLPRPIADCTTKHEPEDRNLSRQEGLALCSLTGAQFAQSLQLGLLGAWAVRVLLGRIGLLLWDIKWEFALDQGQSVFVDTIDTDSLRATRFLDTPKGRCVIHFNKQCIRDYYSLVHPAWMEGVNAAKERSHVEGGSFRAILAEGQKSGLYPPTPVIDAELLALQSTKMALIQQFMLGQLEPAKVSEQLDDVARREFAFYQNRNLDQEFLKRNGVGSAL